MAYKAENVVDLKTDLILAAEIYHADDGDARTLVDSVMVAQHHLSQAGLAHSIDEVAADKGYHAAETLELAEDLSLRTYIPEPQRKHERVWTDKPAGYERAVTNNRRQTQRTGGADLRAHVRDRRCQTPLALRHREGAKAVAGARGSAELGLGAAQAVWNWHRTDATRREASCPTHACCLAYRPEAPTTICKPLHPRHRDSTSQHPIRRCHIARRIELFSTGS